MRIRRCKTIFLLVRPRGIVARLIKVVVKYCTTVAFFHFDGFFEYLNRHCSRSRKTRRRRNRSLPRSRISAGVCPRHSEVLTSGDWARPSVALPSPRFKWQKSGLSGGDRIFRRTAFTIISLTVLVRIRVCNPFPATKWRFFFYMGLFAPRRWPYPPR